MSSRDFITLGKVQCITTACAPRALLNSVFRVQRYEKILGIENVTVQAVSAHFNSCIFVFIPSRMNYPDINPEI